jgi:hypothetical protein
LETNEVTKTELIIPNMMKALEGLKVKNQYGETRTILIVKGTSVLTYEEPNNYYHITKLFKDGQSLDNLNIKK